MISPIHQQLFNRIISFSIDESSASFPFSQKLAQQQGWSVAYTERVITEYKRFIFLCCISPNGASPSEDVDDVWHLHLTYTENYWKKFCADTLGRDIHHHPSRGGSQEKEKHLLWYADTLALYEQVFSEKPPPDIWPQPAIEKPEAVPALPSEPIYPFHRAYWLGLLALPVAVLLLYGQFNPYRLNGPQFAWFYGTCIVALLSFFQLLAGWRTEFAESLIQLFGQRRWTPFQLARYVHSQRKAIETAVVDLAARKLLLPAPGYRFEWVGEKAVAPGDSNPVAIELAKRYSNYEGLMMQQINSCYNELGTFDTDLQQIRERFNWGSVIFIWLMTAAVAVMGFARILQGFSHGKPVGYLLILMIVAAFGVVVLWQRCRVAAALKRAFKDMYTIGQLPVEESSNDDAINYIFAGIAGLVSIKYADQLYLQRNLSRYKENSSLDGSGSGCGSGCGSNGCGGDGGSSCGGGGCGGCGGD